LGLSLWSITGYSADDEDDKANKEAQQAVLKLVDSMNGNKGDIQGQVAAIKKKFDELKPIMWVYKPRKKGGIGMSQDGAGFENELSRLGGPKSRLTPQKVAQLKPDLTKIAEISKAIAEVSDHYAPKKDTAKWKGYTKEMRKASDELIQSAKGGNPVQVKKAINNLNSTCTNCHSDFRE
jgi:hypothetical protein